MTKFTYNKVLNASVTIPNMSATFVSRTLARNHRQLASPAILLWRVSQSTLVSTPATVFSTVPQPKQDKGGKSTWLKVLLFIPGAITFGLGTWQIFRRQEKIKMLEYRQSRLGTEPLKGNEIVPSIGNLDCLEFRRVQCKGVLDEKKSIYVGPRSRSISGVTENGYYLITPLIPVPGDLESVQSPVLVNRGWVPRIWRDKALDALEDESLSSSSSTSIQETAKIPWWRFWSNQQVVQEEHLSSAIPVEVIGVIRNGEKPSIFVPANDPNASQWFYVDVPALAHACGLPEETLYVEDINENIKSSSPYPLAKDVNTLIRSSVMPQDHLNYTLTWYSLSAAVTFMAIMRLKPTRSRR